MNTHMAQATKLLGPHALVSWELFRFPEGAPYAVEIAVTWASVEARLAALATEEGKRMAGDVVNFSKKKPIVMLREPGGSGPANNRG